jgi:hypothetical protein
MYGLISAGQYRAALKRHIGFNLGATATVTYLEGPLRQLPPDMRPVVRWQIANLGGLFDREAAAEGYVSGPTLEAATIAAMGGFKAVRVPRASPIVAVGDQTALVAFRARRPPVQPHYGDLLAEEGVLGKYIPIWRLQNYPGRLGEVLGRTGLKRPVLIKERMIIQRGLSKRLLRETIRHEKFHEWYARNLPELSYLSESDIPFLARGPAIYTEEIFAYGFEQGEGFRLRPISAFKSLGTRERLDIGIWVGITVGAGASPFIVPIFVPNTVSGSIEP